MALSYDITDETTHVKILITEGKGGDSIRIPKNDAIIRRDGQCLGIYYNGLITMMEYSNVSTPASTDVTNLEEILSTYFYI